MACHRTCAIAPLSSLLSYAPIPYHRFAVETLAALNVMHDHAASSPERKTELAALLASGAVTQAAINHAGHCDGGERSRGGGCLPSPLPLRHTLSCTLPLPPQPPLGRPSAAAYILLVAPLSANAS